PSCAAASRRGMPGELPIDGCDQPCAGQRIEEAPPMDYRYSTCDVFTETRFGGNPLAVLPHAEGLSERQMQQIAREFNFSESAFVFPAEAAHTRKVRIFTPVREVPFAGHPNIGTAFVLASAGEFGQLRSALTVLFEEQAGVVSIGIRAAHGKVAACDL